MKLPENVQAPSKYGEEILTSAAESSLRAHTGILGKGHCYEAEGLELCGVYEGACGDLWKFKCALDLKSTLRASKFLTLKLDE